MAYTNDQIQQIVDWFFTQGTRQYIGSRYVPVFADPIAHSSSRTYEPLTIVQHQGNSYTSKQYVPTGIAVTDTRYWALTGNYNAQIETYRQEVQEFDSRIDALEDTTSDIESILANDIRVIIGDSYADGYSPDGNTTPFWEQIRQNVGREGIDVRCYHQGGYGFYNGGFTTLTNNAVNGISADDKKKVTQFVYVGCYNDFQSPTASAILDGMVACAQLIRNNFPNCHDVLVCPVGNCVQGLTTGVHANTTYQQILTVHNRWIQQALAAGFNVMYNGICALKSKEYYSSDYVHPNQNGQYVLANVVQNAMFHNTFFYSTYNILPRNDSLTIGDNEQFERSTWNYTFKYDNESIHFNLGAKTVNILGDNGIDVVCDGESSHKLSIPIVWQTPEREAYGQQELKAQILVRYHNDTVQSNRYVYVDCKLVFTETSLDIYCRKLNDEGNNFLTIPKANQLQLSYIPPFSITPFYQDVI